MPQLRQVHIENYRCLRLVDLDFEPLTVLVGPNASGKTALPDALQPGLSVSIESIWQRDSKLRIQRWGTLTNDQKFQDETSSGGRSMPSRWSYLRLQLLPSHLRMPNGVTEEVQLGQDGSNLANVLGTLPRKRQAQIAKRLCELVPLYADVDVRPAPNTGYHRVVFQDRWKDFWYDPHHVSDGTMILLAFLTLAYMQRPPGACVAVAVAR